MGEGGGSARSSGDHGRLARVERQLAVAQQITHIGSWEWDVATNAVTWSDELYRIYGFEPQSRDITFEFFLSLLHPDDRARVQGKVEGALARGTRFAYPERIVRPDGSVRRLDTVGEVARDAEGRP
ncbi:MAG TPA: PAS domain-containing protein, partial [Polyangiaceae bacterium]